MSTRFSAPTPSSTARRGRRVEWRVSPGSPTADLSTEELKNILREMPSGPDVWTLQHFLTAARGHLAGADVILVKFDNTLDNTELDEEVPIEKARSTAVYLAHVATECVIKARFLHNGGFNTTVELENAQPRVHKALFKTANGHNLRNLAEKLGLDALMTAEDETWPNDDCWTQLCKAERPYSLRYGAEALQHQEAEAQVVRAKKIFNVLALPLNRLDTQQRAKNDENL